MSPLPVPDAESKLFQLGIRMACKHIVAATGPLQCRIRRSPPTSAFLLYPLSSRARPLPFCSQAGRCAVPHLPPLFPQFFSAAEYSSAAVVPAEAYSSAAVFSAEAYSSTAVFPAGTYSSTAVCPAARSGSRPVLVPGRLAACGGSFGVPSRPVPGRLAACVKKLEKQRILPLF